jgi:hypothetical protein
MGAEVTDERGALRALVEAYAACADRRDTAGFADLFTVDATLTTFDAAGAVGSRYEGRSAIAEIPERLRRYDVTLHLVGGHHVEVDGATATGTVACEAHHVRGTDDRVLMIRYVDGYLREDRWRFTDREVRVLWVERRAVER